MFNPPPIAADKRDIMREVALTYRRGDLFDKLGRVHGRWAKFCAQAHTAGKRSLAPRTAGDPI
jgi:hypothetical protein